MSDEPTNLTKDIPLEKPTIPKEPKKELSMTQQIKDLLSKKLDEGYKLIDKHSKVELNKIIRDELKIVSGNHSDINRAIKEIAIKKGLQISDLGFKNDKIGDMTVSIIKNETKEPELKPNVSQSPHGALPKETQSESSHGALPKESGSDTLQTEQSEQPKKKHMSQDAQERLIKKGLNDLIAPLYISLGIVEPDEEEKEDEAKLPTAKKFRADMDDLGTDINTYLIENQIQLPALLNHLAIALSIFMVLVVPVIKFKFFSSKTEAKPSYDTSADNIEVKA